jgi:hypothetical protein
LSQQVLAYLLAKEGRKQYRDTHQDLLLGFDSNEISSYDFQKLQINPSIQCKIENFFRNLPTFKTIISSIQYPEYEQRINRRRDTQEFQNESEEEESNSDFTEEDQNDEEPFQRHLNQEEEDIAPPSLPTLSRENHEKELATESEEEKPEEDSIQALPPDSEEEELQLQPVLHPEMIDFYAEAVLYSVVKFSNQFRILQMHHFNFSELLSVHLFIWQRVTIDFY